MEPITIGNIVRINHSFIDEDSALNLKDYEGVVRMIFSPDENDPDETLYLIEWTEKTLKQIPDNYYIKLFTDEKEWSYKIVPEHILLKVEGEYNADAVEWEKNAIGARLFWQYFGRSGKLIQSLFPNDKEKIDRSPYDTWLKYLNQNLRFPFEATIFYEYEPDDGILQPSDLVNVQGLAGWDYPLGIFCEVQFKGKYFILPLQDIGMTNEVSKNARILNAYEAWLLCRA